MATANEVRTKGVKKAMYEAIFSDYVAEQLSRIHEGWEQSRHCLSDLSEIVAEGDEFDMAAWPKPMRTANKTRIENWQSAIIKSFLTITSQIDLIEHKKGSHITDEFEFEIPGEATIHVTFPLFDPYECRVTIPRGMAILVRLF